MKSKECFHMCVVTSYLVLTFIMDSAELKKNGLPGATVLEFPKVSPGESEYVNTCTYASDCTSPCTRTHGDMRM